MDLLITLKKQKSKKQHIQIDFSNSRIWDESAVGALVKVIDLLKEKGIDVEIIEIDASSKKIVDKLNSISALQIKGGFIMYKNILLASDGSENAVRAAIEATRDLNTMRI